MKKKKRYFKDAVFEADILKEAITGFHKKAEQLGYEYWNQTFNVEFEEHEWDYSDVEPFISDYRTQKRGYFNIKYKEAEMSFSISRKRQTQVAVTGENRDFIEDVLSVFEKHYASSKVEANKLITKQPSPKVFIGHGRSSAWRDLKDHLQDKHGITVIAYETGARAGHSIRDILVDMSQKSNFALLVLTAEDTLKDDSIRARQNVVHEVGLFQGKLGFNRAIVLMEHDVEEFSNIYGVQQIRFSGINETFGEVLATIRREFGSF